VANSCSSFARTNLAFDCKKFIVWHESWVEKQIPPLRCAPVGMTLHGQCGRKCRSFVDTPRHCARNNNF